MRINTNILSLSAQRNLGNTTRAFSRAMERLASGLRINSARDDAAGMAIGTGLDAQRRGMIQAVRNINDARGFLNTAEGAMAVQNDLVQRMRELSIQSANGTLSSDDRKYLNAELQQLLEEFNRVTQQTQFNGVNLLDGSFTTTGLQVGTTKGVKIDFSITSMAASSVFTARETWGTGSYTQSTHSVVANESFRLNSADFNNDGNLDLINGYWSGSTVRISMGNGDGTFAAASSVTMGTGPYSAIGVDVNSDGKTDLVSADLTDNTVSVRLGNGNGTFGSRTTLAVGGDVRNVEAGDFNGDGKLDLITSNWTLIEGSSLFLGNGDGTFQNRTTPFSSQGFIIKTAVADMNSDGELDLIRASYSGNRISVSLGNGNGTFQAETLLSAGANPYSVSVGDLNNDGELDIVSADQTDDTLSVFYGAGGGVFQARVTLGAGDGPSEVLLKDVNGDGNMDIVSSDASTSTSSIILGNGNGTFKSRTTIAGGSSSYGIVVDDFNGDGINDVATNAYNTSTLMISLQGSAEVTTRPAVTITTQEAAEDMLEVFDYALNYINSARASIGATTSRLDFAQAVSESLVENLSFAKSQIMDADISAEVAEFSRLQILQQAGLAVLSQANMSSRLTLKLLENI